MIKDHLIRGETQFRLTPNLSVGTITPRYLIIHHSASYRMAGTVDWLCDPESKVSAHLVIGRDGQVVQLAPFNRKAWHCGVSEWNGEESLNNCSIGIELIGLGSDIHKDKDGNFWSGEGGRVPADEVEQATHKNRTELRYWHKYTPEQIEVCKNVAREIFQAYNLKDVLGHDDIAPTRKTDPGPLFPMDEVKAFALAGKDPTSPKVFKAHDVYFTAAKDGEGFYVTIEDKEGDLGRRITTAEAGALRDWLNENLKQ